MQPVPWEFIFEFLPHWLHVLLFAESVYLSVVGSYESVPDGAYALK